MTGRISSDPKDTLQLGFKRIDISDADYFFGTSDINLDGLLSGRMKLSNVLSDIVLLSDLRLDKLGLEYRYITRYLRGELRTLDELRTQLGVAIRQFAKEQITWFKRDSRIIWLAPFTDYFREACHRIREWEGTPIKHMIST